MTLRDSAALAAAATDKFFRDYATSPWFMVSAACLILLGLVVALATVPKLTVAPAGTAKFSGPPGGSFVPQLVTYSIHNRGLPLAWWLKGVPTWMEAGAQSGVMLSRAEQTIQFRPSAAAKNLPPGIYLANIQFVASSLSEIPSIELALEIEPIARRPAARPVAAPLQLSDLVKLPCSRILAVQRENLKILTGFVGSETALDQVRQIADDVPSTVLGDIVIAKSPGCDILKILERALASTDPPKIDVGSSVHLREGDTFKVEVQAPGTSEFLQVFYLQADGTVVRLLGPSAGPVSPGQVFVFGDGQDGHQKFIVAPPFGQEMIVAISSAHAMFNPPYPDRQSAGEFLSALTGMMEASGSESSSENVRAAAKLLYTQRR